MVDFVDFNDFLLYFRFVLFCKKESDEITFQASAIPSGAHAELKHWIWMRQDVSKITESILWSFPFRFQIPKATLPHLLTSPKHNHYSLMFLHSLRLIGFFRLIVNLFILDCCATLSPDSHQTLTIPDSCWTLARLSPDSHRILARLLPNSYQTLVGLSPDSCWAVERLLPDSCQTLAGLSADSCRTLARFLTDSCQTLAGLPLDGPHTLVGL